MQTLHDHAPNTKQTEIKHNYDDHSYNRENDLKSKQDLNTLSHQHKEKKSSFMRSIRKFFIGG